MKLMEQKITAYAVEKRPFKLAQSRTVMPLITGVSLTLLTSLT